MIHIDKLLILLLLSLTATSCGEEEEPEDTELSYEVVWSDEFDGQSGSAPNPATWSYDIGRGQNGWGNAELQHYTDRPENVALDGNGNLVITAINESFDGASYTSARIKSQGTISSLYGRFEARIKLPSGQGLWPAFWMLGENITSVGWPNCGEIDILELRGQEPNKVLGSVHGPGYSAGNAISGSFTLPDGGFDDDFHVFAVEWSEDRIDYFVDGNLYHTVTPSTVRGDWVFNTDFFMILNVAVGGNFVGAPDNSTTFPQTMTVDYVRISKLR